MKKRTFAILGIAVCGGIAAALVYFFRNYEIVYEREDFRLPTEEEIEAELIADEADALLDEYDQIQEELADKADALLDEYDQIQAAKKQKAKEIADKKRATRAKNTAARQ